MLILSLFFSTLFYCVRCKGECSDYRGIYVNNGSHYIPGPDKCKLCVCDNGEPIQCKDVLCAPPQDCRSFRVGSSCCEFICLDDVLKPAEPSAAVRVIGGVSSVLLLLAISYMFYRAFKGRPRPPHGDDQRSLTSIGYISGSMAYVGGSCEAGNMSAWKPPSNYLPRGEAPPPYDEAVAQSRAEAMRLTAEPAYHRAYPMGVDNMTRTEDIHYPAHSFANIPRPIMQGTSLDAKSARPFVVEIIEGGLCPAVGVRQAEMIMMNRIPNMQSCYNAPLLQTVHQTDNVTTNVLHHHPLAPNVFPSSVGLSGSLGAISGGRGGMPPSVGPMPPSVGPMPPSVGPPLPAREDRPLISTFYATTHHTPMHGSFHRTIPRISTACTILDTSLSKYSRHERGSLQNEIRRSFHKPCPESRTYAETGRSMPRINLASNTDVHRTNDGENINRSVSVRPRILSEGSAEKSQKNVPKCKVPQTCNMPQNLPQTSNVPQITHVNSATQMNSVPQSANQTNHNNVSAPQNTLPLTVDKPSCVCSYDGPSAPAAEDTDDYRSECENCKSASSSRWVLDSGWDEVEVSVTLERRPSHNTTTAAEPPAPATLPTSHRPSRNTVGPPSNWDSWFNTIPDSDTDTEE